MRGVLGSARVPRASFGVAPKQSFLLNLITAGGNELTRKIRDREDALANTRAACATRAAIVRRLVAALRFVYDEL
jgi:hypothetical protein